MQQQYLKLQISENKNNQRLTNTNTNTLYKCKTVLLEIVRNTLSRLGNA